MNNFKKGKTQFARENGIHYKNFSNWTNEEWGKAILNENKVSPLKLIESIL